MQKSEKKIRLEQLSIESEIERTNEKKKYIYIYISSENAAVFRIEDFYQFQVSKAHKSRATKKRKKRKTEGKNATNLTFYTFFLFVFIYKKKNNLTYLFIFEIYSTFYS